MWTHLKQDLADLLASRVFKVLLRNEEYRLFLNRCGLTAIPRSLDLFSNHARAELSEMARMHAQLLVNQLSGLDALRERRAKALVINGAEPVYRLWNSKYPSSRDGFWWFSQGLLDASAEAGATRTERLAWLRDRLAVSLDWSDCDRIAVLHLQPLEELPVIQAMGLPQPVYSKTAWKNPDVPMSEYWKNKGVSFEGGATQTYVIWVPSHRVSDCW